MSYLARIADRVLNRPLLLDPQKAEVILWVLGGRIGVDAPKPAPEENRFIGETRKVAGQRAYGVQSGAAIITIEGSLVNRGDWIGADSGLVAYEGIEAQLAAALGDANVNSIILDFDSPGGEATGMAALAEKIRAARDIKPIVALVNDLAASAAYGLAAQANFILVSPTSIVGSIGVVLLHLDRSKQYDAAGVKPTLIFAGAHKVDGNPFAPLSDAVKSDLQRDVMTFYDRFVEVVAAGRGPRLTVSAARATEARTFIGQEAIDRGLADRLGGIAEAISLAGLLAAEKRVSTGKDPAGRPNGTSSSPGTAPGPTKDAKAMDWKDITAESLRQNRPDLASAIEGDVASKVTAARAEGEASGKAVGAAAERDRLAGIDKLMPVGMEKLRDELKADAGMTPERAAVRYLEAGNAALATRMQGLKDADKNAAVPAAPIASAGGGGATPKFENNEAGWKAEFAAGGTGFAAEEDFVAFKKQEAAGNVRLLTGKRAAA